MEVGVTGGKPYIWKTAPRLRTAADAAYDQHPRPPLQDQIITQEEVQDPKASHDQCGAPSGNPPEANRSAAKQPKMEAMPNGVEQKQASSFTSKSKKKMDPNGVEQQPESFTKQLEGYLPRFYWHQQQAQTKSQKRIYDACLNLRDVGANMPALMKPGIVFRSSELLR